MKETYITRAILKDYLTIKDVDITFNKDINIIIGQNGTGKTNFINYLNDSLMFRSQFTNNISSIYFFSRSEEIKKESLISTYLDKNLAVNNIQDVKFYKGNKKLVTGLPYKVDIDPIIIRHGLPKKYIIADESLTDVVKRQGELGFIIFPNSENNSISNIIGLHYVVDVFYEGEIEKVFDFNRLLELLNVNLNEYTSISEVRLGLNANINTTNPDEIHFNNIYFEYLVNDEWLLFNQLSDGIKRLFYIISEITFSNKAIILLEEPELGLHPHQLYKLMDFIKESSKKFQFIITTHSPVVLNMIQKDELSSIIVATIEKGATKLNHLTEEQVEKAKAYMDVADLSDYWMHSDLEEA